MQRNKKIIFIVLGVLVILIGYSLSGDDAEEIGLTATVERGKFQIEVTTTGELQAKKSEKVRGPSGLRKARIYNIKITDLVPEGTLVNEGDYIGTLDKTETDTKLNEISTDLEKVESQYITTRLDTALDLRGARDELINLHYDKEEKKLVQSQSKFEPPASIRKAEIDLEKADRALEQATENYRIKQEKAIAKMKEVGATLRQQRVRLAQILELIQQLEIKAPKAGMVIYQKEWDGRKIVAGSSINTWGGAVVATLPDLSVMISKTYVNEVDISKLKKDQSVQITIDAFPDNEYSGKVVSIANVGEQRPGSDAKVFEVEIELTQVDSILRPSMTSNNYILINSYDDVLYVPIESIFNNDSISYVFLDNATGIERKEVDLGQSNDNYIIIEEGLEEGQGIFLSKPKEGDNIEMKILQQ